MAKTQILDYYIHLTDKARVDTLNAQLTAGGGPDVGQLIYNGQTHQYGVFRAPYTAGPPEGGAAVEFGESGTLPRNDSNDPWVAPCLQSDWFDKDFPLNVQTFTRKDGWWLFGHETKFYWSGHFVYNPLPGTGDTTTATDGSINERAVIPQRLFIDGFEQANNASTSEGASSTTSLKATRDASRTLEGFGLAYAHNNVSSASRRHDYSPSRSETQERFYVKARRYPTVATEIWQAKYPGTNPGGLYLYLAANGTLAIYASSGATPALLAPLPAVLPLDTWTCLDVVVRFAVGTANLGTLRVWVNKVFRGAATFTGGGLPGNFKHSFSTLGRDIQTDNTDGEILFDDWVAMAPALDKAQAAAWDPATHPSPYAVGDVVAHGTWASLAADPTVPASLAGLPTNWIAKASAPITVEPGTPAAKDTWHRLIDAPDFVVGSHIQCVKASALGAGHGVWSGAPVQAFWTRHPNTSTTDVPSSTTANDPVVLTMDVAELKRTTGVVGFGALCVDVMSHRGTTVGQLGYDVGSGVVLTTLTGEIASLGHSAVFYAPAAVADIPPLPATLTATYVKGNDAGLARVKALHMLVELFGTFSPCDIGDDPKNADTPRPPAVRGYHNGAYPFGPWAVAEQGTLGPVVVQSGTYTGNGTAKDLTFPAPVSFLFIRPTGAVAPTLAVSTQMGTGHAAFAQGTGTPYLNRLDLNPGFAGTPGGDQQTECRLTLVGTDARVNANGTVYEFVAIMDPAHRFVLAGARTHANSVVPVTDPLEHAAFTAEVGFFQKEEVTTTTTPQLWFKGPGHAAAGAQNIGTPTAEAASAISFLPGALKWDSGYLTATEFEQIAAFSLFRRADGNNDPGQTALFHCGSYVGDGTASRSVSLPPSGKRPLFAIVAPANANNAVWRDPLHTSTNSSALPSGATSATGITGGAVDGFSVGTSLNASGTTYTYFVVMGSATAGNGGWSIDGTFVPVSSDSPGDPDWVEPTFPEPPDGGGGGGGDDDEPDLGTDCIASTQRLVNIALSRIGVSKVIADLAAENTMEAALARLHVKTDVEACLADFAWPFATRYADLVLVAGTPTAPANVDWQYAYRAPADMVAARRIGGQGMQRRAYDPSPITFRVGSDATGALIYCDAPASASVPLVLEYTVRLSCPAATGTPLFKDALAWRFAASLAMPLARDSQKQAQCLAMYGAVLRQAEVMAAREHQPDKPGDAEWITGRA